ncbi:hypothetical protein [Variovorax sp. UMC13]|uniref:hypothetical protein n=1 Tax=Variovorax sp. UMC13 TaxID=1862326 RepID=UPI001603864D|nr:hypothetical protein [Variovorax sp. UMC13]MBB1599613.1 hypothetical protein [Variovorax sp. UMC13]
MRDHHREQDEAGSGDEEPAKGIVEDILSTEQKVSILCKEGAVVPTLPVRRASRRRWFGQRREFNVKRVQRLDAEHEQSLQEWKKAVDMLFAAWLTAQR